MSELDDALAMADVLLDEPMCDPDDDLRTLARQLTRQHETAVYWKQQHDLRAAQLDHFVKIFSNIMLCMPAPPVKIEDGRMMQFVDPDPARTLRLLQRSIEEARAAVESTKATHHAG